MPVTYPVVELIAQELYDRLNAMATEPYTYQTHVSSVIRPKTRNDEAPEHLKIILKQDTLTERVPDLDYPGNPPAVARRVTFRVHCYQQSEDDTGNFDALIQQFASDVVKAVTVTGNAWHSMDGNAVDSEFGEFEQIGPDGGLRGIIVPVIVTYRTDEDDPYTVRA